MDKDRGYSVRCNVSTTSVQEDDAALPLPYAFVSHPLPQVFVMLFDVQRGFMVMGEDRFSIVVLTECFFPTLEELEPYPDKFVPWSAWGEKKYSTPP
jgi:hypothetical protein